MGFIQILVIPFSAPDIAAGGGSGISQREKEARKNGINYCFAIPAGDVQ
jgi:hypothetical protein